MRNARQWVGLGVLVCATLAFAQAAQQSAGNATSDLQAAVTRDFFDIWTLFFAGVTAIGSLAVAALAIFGQNVRSWIVRPKISLKVGNRSQLAEKLEEEDTSASGGKRTLYHVRMEVLNSGRDIARNCTIFCDAVHRRNAGGVGFYELKNFVPKQFFWTSRDQRLDVIPHISSYVNIAEISESLPSSPGPPGAGAAAQHECLKIMIEADGIKGRYFCIENGTIALPIILYADNLPRPIKKYVEISWGGACVTDFSPDKFQIRLLGEEQGKALLGGGQ
jgi:hypothetical protein